MAAARDIVFRLPSTFHPLPAFLACDNRDNR